MFCFFIFHCLVISKILENTCQYISWSKHLSNEARLAESKHFPSHSTTALSLSFVFCLAVYLSVCLSVCLFIYLPLTVSVCLSVCHSLCVSVSFNLPVNLSVELCLSVALMTLFMDSIWILWIAVLGRVRIIYHTRLISYATKVFYSDCPQVCPLITDLMLTLSVAADVSELCLLRLSGICLIFLLIIIIVRSHFPLCLFKNLLLYMSTRSCSSISCVTVRGYRNGAAFRKPKWIPH